MFGPHSRVGVSRRGSFDLFPFCPASRRKINHPPRQRSPTCCPGSVTTGLTTRLLAITVEGLKKRAITEFLGDAKQARENLRMRRRDFLAVSGAMGVLPLAQTVAEAQQPRGHQRDYYELRTYVRSLCGNASPGNAGRIARPSVPVADLRKPQRQDGPKEDRDVQRCRRNRHLSSCRFEPRLLR